PTPTETPPPTPTPTPTPTPEETPQPTPTPSPTPNNMVWSQNYNGQDGLQSGSWYWDVAKGLKEAVSATVADDWQSTPGLSLIRITWWGAYEGWSETTQNEVAPPSGNPEKYRIALNDYQDGYPPKPAITEKSIVFAESFTETWERAIPKWDEDGKWIHVFRYEQELDVLLLFESQTRYFLSIVAAYKDVPVYPWGWMSSWQRWNAAAVQKKSGADWEELIWPAGHRLFPQSMDMAFQLTAAQQSTPTPTPTPWPSPTPTPTPTPTGRFASQPPNMTDGFDIGCWSEFKGVETAFVADDFEALQDSPITGIRWWGSYAGWRDTESSRVPPPLVTPVQYIISFHERLEPPAVGPGKLLSEDICRAPFESWYGAVPKKGEPGKFEHEFAYLGMLNNPFEPVAGNTYVLSIQAVFTTGTTHLDWGWLNSEENWGNPATHQWSSTDWTNLTWSAGHRLAGGPMNMAFEIWTGPAPDPVPQPVQLALTVFAQNGAVQKTPEEAHYNFGDSVQLQATPANGYFFTHWSGDLPDYYVPPAPFTSNPINIIMDTEKVLTAHFSPLAAALTLIINSEHGAAIRHPDYPAYPAGTKVTIGVKPDKGYCFTGWSGDVPSGAASQNPAEITMDVSRTITAQYEILTAARLREIIMSRSPGPGQDVNGDGRIDVADVIALLLPPR
ncbi:MAG TPA: hypothetical protein PLB62_12995, partial [Candidatus Sumerlaeota bacterium]|nr:hypothetical protein [Candidatus Sumerlaeota bacterium]